MNSFDDQRKKFEDERQKFRALHASPQPASNCTAEPSLDISTPETPSRNEVAGGNCLRTQSDQGGGAEEESLESFMNNLFSPPTKDNGIFLFLGCYCL